MILCYSNVTMLLQKERSEGSIQIIIILLNTINETTRVLMTGNNQRRRSSYRILVPNVLIFYETKLSLQMF